MSQPYEEYRACVMLDRQLVETAKALFGHASLSAVVRIALERLVKAKQKKAGRVA
jgi:hypothetical protein